MEDLLWKERSSFLKVVKYLYENGVDISVIDIERSEIPLVDMDGKAIHN